MAGFLVGEGSSPVRWWSSLPGNRKGLVKRYAKAGNTVYYPLGGTRAGPRGSTGQWAEVVHREDMRGRRRTVRMAYEAVTFQASRSTPTTGTSLSTRLPHSGPWTVSARKSPISRSRRELIRRNE
jgi:hypothetical protein